MNKEEKEDITFKAAEIETWLKSKGAACASIKVDAINGIDIIAKFDAQKPLSEIIGVLQERPDVTMQSTSSTKDGWLVHIKATAQQQKVKVLLNLDWNDVISQVMPTLSIIVAALFLILAANACDSLMSISRSITKVINISGKIEQGIKDAVPSVVKELKDKSPLPSAFQLMPMQTMQPYSETKRETMTYPEEKKATMKASDNKETPTANKTTAVEPSKLEAVNKSESKQSSAPRQDASKASNQTGVMNEAVMKAIEEALNNAAMSQKQKDMLVVTHCLRPVRLAMVQAARARQLTLAAAVLCVLPVLLPLRMTQRMCAAYWARRQ